MQAAITSGLLDRVSIQDRQGHVLYRAGITDATSDQVAHDAVVALTRGRDVASFPSEDARDWLTATTAAVRRCADAGERDPDVLGSIRQITEDDAPAMAHIAHPGDPGRATAATQEMRGQAAILQAHQLRALRGPATTGTYQPRTTQTPRTAGGSRPLPGRGEGTER